MLFLNVPYQLVVSIHDFYHFSCRGTKYVLYTCTAYISKLHNDYVMLTSTWKDLIPMLSMMQVHLHTSLLLIYSTDLMQCRTHEWHALESNPLSTKISSIHHRVRVDALVKFGQKKHLQEALTEYLISNS